VSYLEHLTALIGFDTQNPPRAIRAGDPIFGYLQEALRAANFTCEIEDLGNGCVNLYAVRGEPTLLFNVHMDTVPAAAGWSASPHEARVEGERLVGLGACDTKGAAACLLDAAAATRGPAAILFSSDEEAGDDHCVKHFLERRVRGQKTRLRGALVAEPTGCRAVLGHRGIASVAGTFRGVAGHASSPRALADSALHEAVRWASRALALAAEEEQREVAGLTGIRFNLGILQGGIKSNMIADRATLRFGVRSRPGEDPLALAERIAACAPDRARADFQIGFVGPTLPPPGAAPAEALAAELGLALAPPVDFWSEASLFAAAGLPSLVYGPGDIAQAHAADEWVAVDQLRQATDTYLRILQG
jgi:acetylornithine deacetylase